MGRYIRTPEEPLSEKEEIEKAIIAKQDEIKALKKNTSKLENGQKIIIGGMMLSLAREDANIASELLKRINEKVTRPADIKRILDITRELNKIVNKANEPTEQEPAHQDIHQQDNSPF